MSEPMSMHLDKVVTTTKVSANIDDGGERREVVLKETEEVLAEKFFEHHPIKVYMDYSTTINLGNYESAKVSIGMSIPVGKEVPNMSFEQFSPKLINLFFRNSSKYLSQPCWTTNHNLAI